MLADDSVTAQNMGRKILADAGYEVITVNNGSAALKKIAETKPDLIVLDVYMPGYSGLEVCQRLKENAETARIPTLLTVGKLEPFKPEEARRVRAEGFIVKPFEASELLSALTKLEDKMVPRAESSKPGRFARAIAAVEEGRYDKSVAPEPDSGWKNRISFPSKKKRKSDEVPEDGDDPAIYNAVNKDLRTVVDHKPSPIHAPEPQNEHVDLAALAPEGLPKDVTPEEIAALAAAAAQIQGKMAEIKGSETIKESAALAEHAPDNIDNTAPAPSPVEEPRAEEKLPEVRVPEEVPASAPAAASIPEVATIAAIDSVDHSAGATDNHESARAEFVPAQPEAVTMALAAGAEQAFHGARWTAVSVAVDPEESAVVLEEEMRKAYAAMASMEAVPAEMPSPVAQASAAISEPAPVSETSSAIAPQPEAPVQPEVSQPISSPSIESVSTPSLAVKNFETVSATSSVPEPEPVASPADTVSLSAQVDEVSAAPMDQPPSLEAPVTSLKESEHQVPAEQSPDSSHMQEPVPTPTVTVASEEIAPMSAPSQQPVPPEPAVTTHAAFAEGATVELAETAAAVPSAAATPNKESDIAKTTAAAWASWRRIRESADPASSATSSPDAEDSSSAVAEAAMAVAAGAEKAPEESPEIESIVDSVLADLRPKIVEEISKKLKQKK